MPQRSRKPTASTIAHPLFPAVVALWLGALFGLASLAVRPALLEALVVRSGIDLAIPAAAAPLGVTARLLVALALAAIGSLLGAMIGRRLARAAPKAPERKRSMRETLAEAALAEDEADQEESILTQRRRSLTFRGEEFAPAFVPVENAPVPGAPQVFDISAVSLDDEQHEDPLDLADYDPLPAEEEEARPIFAAPEAPHPPVEFTAPAMLAMEEAPAPAAAPVADDITGLASRLTESMARRRAARPAPEDFASGSPSIPRLPLVAGAAPMPAEPAESNSFAAPQQFFAAPPETANEPDAIEPVVIFPGQIAAQPQPKNDVPSFRSFDAPGSAVHGRPVSAGEASPTVDPTEAERALRMALASLQRMSGAA